MSGSLVDWRVAERVAVRVSGASEADGRRSPPSLGAERLAATCAEAEALIREYSRLDPAGALPRGEAVGRAEWTRAALRTLGELGTELEREHRLEISLPGPLGGVARSAVRLGAGTEVGLAAGYAARRVLGQYDLGLLGPERPPRLLFVAPNLVGAAAELRVGFEPFLRWVALHETTHAIQFAAAPWLRAHLGDLVRRLLADARAGISLRDLARRLAANPRGALTSFLRGDLARAIAGPRQLPLLDSIQATMTVVEGHAEHVMDAAAADFIPEVSMLRERLERRRRSRGPLETIVARLLGLDLKLRQYELGKRFCDGVVERAGTEALNRIWDGSERLPSLDELERPAAWLERAAPRPAGPATFR